VIGAEHGLLRRQGARVVLGGRLILARLRREIAQIAQQFDDTLLVAAVLGQPYRLVAVLERLRHFVGGFGGFEILIWPAAGSAD